MCIGEILTCIGEILTCIGEILTCIGEILTCIGKILSFVYYNISILCVSVYSEGAILNMFFILNVYMYNLCRVLISINWLSPCSIMSDCLSQNQN